MRLRARDLTRDHTCTVCAGFLNSTTDLGQAAPKPGYGYKGKLDHILKTEFPHLKSKVYADHAGASLYSKSQIDAFQQVNLLCMSLFNAFACKHIAADASFTAMHMPSHKTPVTLADAAKTDCTSSPVNECRMRHDYPVQSLNS